MNWFPSVQSIGDSVLSDGVEAEPLALRQPWLPVNTASHLTQATPLSYPESSLDTFLAADILRTAQTD